MSSSGASASSAFSLVVPVNQLPGGVSTATVIPLHGFLPLDGVGWLYVEPGWAVGVTINFKGDRRVRQIVVCVSFTSLSPHFIGWSLRWRAAVERRSYEERCRDALVIV